MGPLPFLALLSAALLAWSAQAGTIEITPVNIALEFGQNSTMLQVKNSDPEPAAVQVRIYRWTQTGNEDVLTPTSDVILSPPIATIPGGSTQTFRILLRSGRTPDDGSGRRYRILLDEIPTAVGRPGELGFVMRVSIPVFVLPELVPTPALQWRATREQNGGFVLTVVNSATVYDKVDNMVVTADDDTVLNALPRSSNNYALPSSQREWLVQGGVVTSHLHLSVMTRTGMSDQVVPIDP